MTESFIKYRRTQALLYANMSKFHFMPLKKMGSYLALSEARGKAQISFLEQIGYLFSEWAPYGSTYLGNAVNKCT